MRSTTLAAVAWISLVASPSAQTTGEPERFSAMALNHNTADTGLVEILVTRWSTPGEREPLVATLVDEGQDQLIETLREMRPVGRIYTPGSVGYELRFAEQATKPEGGRRIVLAADRPMSFWELVNRPRSADYLFTWVELDLRSDGTGDGQLAIRARVSADRANRPIEVETFDIQPIRLQMVTSRREN